MLHNPNTTDTKRQATYKISAQINFINVLTNLPDNIVINDEQFPHYEISKDSVNNNFNSHLVTFTSISQFTKSLMELDSSMLTIKILENEILLSDKRFKILKVDIIEDIQNMYSLKLTLVSELTFEFLNSSRFAKESNLGTSQVSTYQIAYETLRHILQQMSSSNGSSLNVHFNDAGTIQTLKESIKVPGTLNDIELFSFLFKNYPPYLLNPYFIFDDLYTKSVSETPYNIIISNIINTNGNYNLKNIKTIKNYNLKNIYYFGGTPLMDFAEFKECLESVIVLHNENENKIFELTPEVLNNKSKNKTVNTNMSVETFKKKLYLLNELSEHEASLERYSYQDINLGDIDFLNVYNIQDEFYNHLPVCIEYNFTRDTHSNFSLETFVEYIKLPSNLLVGK